VCQQCLDAVNTHWPHLEAGQRSELLWNCTAFPFGDPDIIESQVAELARRSGGNVSLAFRIADWELEYEMQNADSDA